MCKSNALFQMQTMFFFSNEALLISLSSDDLLHKNYDSSTVVSSQVRKLRFSSLLCIRFKIQKNFSFEGITNIFTSQEEDQVNAQIVHQIHYSLLLWLKWPQEITTYAGLKNEDWFDDSLRPQSVLPTQGIS